MAPHGRHPLRPHRILLLLATFVGLVLADPPVSLLRLPRADSSSAPVFQNPLASSSSSLSSSSSSSSPPTRTTVSNAPSVPTDAPGATSVVPTPFPAPFDLSLSFNFSTVSCQSFFLNFTQDTTFRRCRPFSLLLSSSSQFTQDIANATLLNNVIWGTCNTPIPEAQCKDFMASLVDQVNSQCPTELQQGNDLVQQALTGFQMYDPMRQAACLVNENDNSYCFVDAAINKSPADLYFYQLPYGDTLPSGTVPSCSPCIKSVLAIYASAVTSPPSNNLAELNNASSLLAIGSLPLDQTYGPAAEIAAQQCGAVYAQQVNLDSAAIPRFPLSWLFPLLMFPLGLIF